MHVDRTQSCCTAAEFQSFLLDKDIGRKDWSLGFSKLPTKNQIIQHLTEWKEDNGCAIAIAFLTNKQSEARALLKSVGFISTRAMSKTHHPETKLYMLHLKLDTWNPPKRKGKVK